ncbi:MAG TPA: sodium:proton antiporter [Chthonomonadaceae bacterium]|nr:sodium:proton antiporter [Chthonomonadaceae bacterium]
MALNIERVELLLLVAAFVAMTVRRLRMPYTVGLVAAGLMLALFPALGRLTLTRELVFKVFLPPLIFEAAIQMEWPKLRRDLPVTLVLATAGVLVAAGITAAGVRYLLHWDWPAAILFAAMISATDPASVIATFKDAGVTGRVRMLVEAESLFNDGTAAVLFSVALAATAGAGLMAQQIAGAFLLSFAGGCVCGGVIAFVLIRIVGHTDDHLIEITFSTIAAYGSFLIAEHFRLSGVMATLTAGILFGNYGGVTAGPGAITERGRETVLSFWEYAAFVANSLIFLLIGVQMTHQRFAAAWLPLLVVIAIVQVSRAVTVYGCCLPFARSQLRVAPREQHILFWGGLRGALALALLYGVPPTVHERGLIVTSVFGIVAFSVIVQGLTMPLLLKRLGMVVPGGAAGILDGERNADGTSR